MVVQGSIGVMTNEFKDALTSGLIFSYQGMKIMIGIYKITNNLNQKSYIGQSIDILTRWKQHIYEANHNRLNNTIYQAIRKYGIDNFTFSVLEECQKEQLNEQERYWITYYNTYNNGYNSTPGGQYEDSWVFDPELIKQMWDEGYCNKQICEILGCNHQTVANRLKGYKDYNKDTSRKRGVLYYHIKIKTINSVSLAEEYCYSSAQKNIFINSQVPIYQYSLLGDYIASYPSYAAAARGIGLEAKLANNIRNCIYKENQHTAYGYQWSLNKVEKLSLASVKGSKAVQCLETGKIYLNSTLAAIEVGLKDGSHINACCTGARKSAGKHPITNEKLHWKYI